MRIIENQVYYICLFLALLAAIPGNSAVLTVPEKLACWSATTGVRLIFAQELEPLEPQRVSQNPAHSSYGVYKMRLGNETVAVKIDTDYEPQLLPVFLL